MCKTNLKVRDTRALLAVGGARAIGSEQALAAAARQASAFRIVLHLEQPATPSKLFPRAINPANVLQRLKQLVKAVDPHPRVVEMANLDNMPWTVTVAPARTS